LPKLLRLEGQPDLAGTSLDALLPAEFNEELTRLERRARRMGVASSEFELRTSRGLVNLSVTLAALDPPHGQNHGSILVLEDLSSSCTRNGRLRGKRWRRGSRMRSETR